LPDGPETRTTCSRDDMRTDGSFVLMGVHLYRNDVRATIALMMARTPSVPNFNVRVQPMSVSVRHRARVQYDGSEYCGMQVQGASAVRISVAGALNTVLQQRLRVEVKVNAASRTDAGVHARGQSIHFDVPDTCLMPDPAELERSLNAMLPPTVRVHSIEVASERDGNGRKWHARHSATGKLYSYRLCAGGVLDPLDRTLRAQSCTVDLDAIRVALPLLVGTLDCAAFANRRSGEPLPCQLDEKLTTRVVRAIKLQDEGNANLRVDFHVKSALYKQVRNMMGLLLYVGMGRIAPSEVPTILASRNRQQLPPPAPAHGLTLESVFYNAGWGGKYQHPMHTETVCEPPFGVEGCFSLFK